MPAPPPSDPRPTADVAPARAPVRRGGERLLWAGAWTGAIAAGIVGGDWTATAAVAHYAQIADVAPEAVAVVGGVAVAGLGAGGAAVLQRIRPGAGAGRWLRRVAVTAAVTTPVSAGLALLAEAHAPGLGAAAVQPLTQAAAAGAGVAGTIGLAGWRLGRRAARRTSAARERGLA